MHMVNSKDTPSACAGVVYYSWACYTTNRILEVFAVYEATKTFDFVASFVEAF